MATHCQMTARSRSVKRQNLGGVNSLEGKNGGCQLQTKHVRRVVTCDMGLFSTLSSQIHDIHYMNCFMEELK